MTNILLYITAFVATYIGVELVRRWSVSKQILDVPNERSSHTKPTPSGGGLVIVSISLLSLLIYQVVNDQIILWAYFAGAGFIALISWLDDIYKLSAVWRFLCQTLAAVLIIWQFGVFREFYFPFIGTAEFGLFAFVITILWVVWMTNAFNFMDGIDGIAGLQAITASFGWVILGWIWNLEIFFFFGLILLFANAAFLFHNWSPAKIFMGDVGSAFLGFTFAVFPMLSKFETNTQTMHPYIFLITIMFVWLFFFDTAITLFRRLIRREKIWEAHRSHLYQLLVIRSVRHSTVSLLYAALSLVVILSVVYCLVLNKYEIIFVTLTLMVTATLVLFVYNNNLLTND